ncbi:MAG: diacylglycerol kinase [Wenzhouxiangella sp.]
MSAGPHKPGKPDNELKRWWFATRNSWQGYRRVFADEAAFRAQCMVLLLLLPLAAWLARSAFEFSLLVGIWLLVLAGELINSAIEAAIDRVGPEIHPLSAKAKDAGSAMVLTLMILAGLVWLAVILDRFGGHFPPWS